MWVLHTDEAYGIVTDRIDIYTISVPPNKPVDIKNEAVAKAFLEYKGLHHGMVEVPFVTDDEGVHLDVKGAKEASRRLLAKGELDRVQRYFEAQMEDRIKNGKPALPPDPITARIMRKRSISPESYGIKPVGWSLETAEAGGLDLEAINKLQSLTQADKVDLESQNKALAAKLTRLETLLVKLADANGLALEDLLDEAKAKG